MRYLPNPRLAEYAEQLLADALARHPIKPPKLEWREYRTTAGRAHFDHWAITLSMFVLRDPDQVRDTLLHEYAHLLAFHRHGKNGRGHGSAWQQAMADLGLPPEVKHRYQCQRNLPRQMVVYRCAACGVAIQRARRLPRRRRYTHAGCGGEIVFVSIHSVTYRVIPNETASPDGRPKEE